MSADEQIFHVSNSMELFGRLIANHPEFWRKVGNLETRLLADQLENSELKSPVYVTGLARSGSTILLETLAQIPGVISHRYKDFPPVYTPYWWNWFMNKAGTGAGKPQERAHRDGIMVTPDSPEAIEEVIWMGAFNHLHNPAVSNALTAESANAEFDRFYQEHLKKLLLSRGGSRYLSKGNYLVTRLQYILNMLPDARFVIPVRHPFGHIASLMKQHDLFSRGQQNNLRAREHLKRVGHLEFGLDREPINTGDNSTTQSILKLWDSGEEVRGWARYWNQVYGFLVDQMMENPLVGNASKIIRFEDLCATPADTIRAMLSHCDYPADTDFISSVAAGIHAPSYYKSKFTAQDEAIILEETSSAREKLGYTS
jgi:hypothetical protein